MSQSSNPAAPSGSTPSSMAASTSGGAQAADQSSAQAATVSAKAKSPRKAEKPSTGGYEAQVEPWRFLGMEWSPLFWDCDPDRPVGWGLQQRWGHFYVYATVRLILRFTWTLLYQHRLFNSQVMPRRGGAVLVSNHQSFTDPIVNGISVERIANYLARHDSLEHPIWGAVLRFFSAVGVHRYSADLAALRECIRRLRQGRVLLIYPEGTRSKDGEFAKFEGGFLLLARRAKVPIVPMVHEGTYDVWPRQRKFPRLSGLIAVRFAEPLDYERDIAGRSDEEVLADLRQRMLDAQLWLRRYLKRNGWRPRDANIPLAKRWDEI